MRGIEVIRGIVPQVGELLMRSGPDWFDPFRLCESIGLPICADCFRFEGHEPYCRKPLRPKAAPLVVMLVGPIDYWWNENWMTEEHGRYRNWRDSVSRQLVEAGHLVYRPYEAFKGAWSERAQRVNDAAIAIADCLVNLTPPGVPAHGTEAELRLARSLVKTIYNAPPGDRSQIEHLVVPLKDPYGAVHRKSRYRDVKVHKLAEAEGIF